MPIDQSKSKRKASGGLYRSYRKARQYALGRTPVLTKLGARNTFAVRVIGGSRKHKLRSDDKINVVNPKTKKTSVATIQTVVDNTANRNFIRRNIITKGAIVQTSAGKVRVTSRPGQTNMLNGVLIE